MAVNQVSTTRSTHVYKLAGRSKLDEQALKENWEDIKASAKGDLIEESKKNGYYKDSNTIYKDGVVYERSNTAEEKSTREEKASEAAPRKVYKLGNSYKIDKSSYEDNWEDMKAGAVDLVETSKKSGYYRDSNTIYKDGVAHKRNIDEEKNAREDRKVLYNLSRMFKNANFQTESTGKIGRGKEYSIILSDEEMDILKNGTDEEKNKLYKLIDDGIKELSDMKEKAKGNDLFGKFTFGLSINTKAGVNDSIVSFLAMSGDKNYSASSTDDLIKLISGSNPVDYRV